MNRKLIVALAVALTACAADSTAPSDPSGSSALTPGSRRPTAGDQDPIEWYANNFSGPTVDSHWNVHTISTSPSGERFLGEFLNQSVGLIITALPPHHKLVVTSDVYFIRSWDGTDTQWGPDNFKMMIDATTVLNTTISNVNSNQNYPYNVGGPEVSGGTGALAVNSLGYTYWAEQIPIDATYRFSYTVNHTASVAVIQWAGSGLQYLADESWGLDNVHVSYIP
jgi:hypothetical protein